LPNPSPQVASLANQGIRWVAITWVNHAGAPLVKVVPLAAVDAAAAMGVGFSPVSDAFRADGVIDPAHRFARPDGDLRLRAETRALALLAIAGGKSANPNASNTPAVFATKTNKRHYKDHAGTSRPFSSFLTTL
jgi:glutamine synthetase